MNLGLGNATVQIKAEAQKRASVIILLTDGILQNRDKKKTVEKVNLDDILLPNNIILFRALFFNEIFISSSTGKIFF